MIKRITLLALFSITGYILNAQLQNWQPSQVYSIDKTVIEEIKLTPEKKINTLAEKEFNVLQNKMLKNIAEQRPGFLKLDSLLGKARIVYVGLSSTDIGPEQESVLAPLQGYNYRQYLQREFKKEEVLLKDFKYKIISFVKNAPLSGTIKDEVNNRINALPNHLVFTGEKYLPAAIERINPALSAYLFKSLGGDTWESIKNDLALDAENILAIPKRIEEELTSFFKPGVKAINDIMYFTEQINKTKEEFERIKNSRPDEAIRLLQKTELFHKIIESTNLKEANNFVIKALNIGQDAKKLEQLLSSNDNPLNKAIGTLVILEKNIREFLPSASPELNRSLEAIKNNEQMTKVNFYASLGSFAVNSSNMSSEDKKTANLLISFGVTAFSCYSGEVLGCVTGAIGVLDGLFGGSKGDDGFAKMQMELQQTFVEGVTLINNNLGILSKQITEQNTALYNGLSEQIFAGRKANKEYYEALSSQMQQGFEALHMDMQTISKQVEKLHSDIIKIHEENSLKLNMIEKKLDLLYQQNGCIAKALQEGFLQQVLTCQGITNDLTTLVKAGTISEYYQLFDKETQQCYQGLKDFINKRDPATVLIDYVICAADKDGKDPLNDPKIVFEGLVSIWKKIFGKQTHYLSMLNPSVSVKDDKNILDVVKNNNDLFFTEIQSGIVPGPVFIEGDLLNNATLVSELANWYLQLFPFKAVRNTNTGGIKDEKDKWKPVESNEADKILVELEYFRTILQNTIAQQSLMSGTLLLSNFYNILTTGSYDERMFIMDLLDKNYLLQINLAKYIMINNKNKIDADNNLVIPQQKIVILKRAEGNFYFFLSDNENKNLLNYYKNDKNNIERAIESLLSNSKIIEITDPRTIENLENPERVLPPGFYKLLQLHKKFTNLITEIKLLKTLTPDELNKMKPVYLN